MFLETASWTAQVSSWGAAGAAAIDQGGDRVHAELLAGDVVGVPHLRGDGREIVGSVGLRIVAAVHHRSAQREVYEVGGLVIGPGAVVAERGHARDDQRTEAIADGFERQADSFPHAVRGAIEQDVGAAEQALEIAQVAA